MDADASWVVSEQSTGRVLGCFFGATKEDALDNMAQAAGYPGGYGHWSREKRIQADAVYSHTVKVTTKSG